MAEITEKTSQQPQKEVGEQYGDPLYWESRYSKDPSVFEWHFRYSDAKEVMKALLEGRQKGLEVGCGTSTFSEEILFDNLLTQMNCIDSSNSAIKEMKKRNQEQQQKGKKPLPNYIVMDCANITFEESSFDVVFDKGLLDCLCCGPNSREKVQAYISQVHRVLCSGGILIVASWRPPEQRKLYLEDCPLPEGSSGWKRLEPKQIPKPDLSLGLLARAASTPSKSCIWLYVLQKN